MFFSHHFLILVYLSWQYCIRFMQLLQKGFYSTIFIVMLILFQGWILIFSFFRLPSCLLSKSPLITSAFLPQWTLMVIFHIFSDKSLKLFHVIFLSIFAGRFVFGITGVYGSLGCLCLEDRVRSHSCPVYGIFISRSSSVLANRKKKSVTYVTLTWWRNMIYIIKTDEYK